MNCDEYFDTAYFLFVITSQPLSPSSPTQLLAFCTSRLIESVTNGSIAASGNTINEITSRRLNYRRQHTENSQQHHGRKQRIASDHRKYR